VKTNDAFVEGGARSHMARVLMCLGDTTMMQSIMKKDKKPLKTLEKVVCEMTGDMSDLHDHVMSGQAP